MTDIRQTLEAAFDDEPPLNLDLAAIKKAGRRRAAARRSLVAAAALATVTAVCVPAMLGSSGGGGVQAGGQPSGSVVATTPGTPPGGTTSSRVVPPTPTNPPRPTSGEHAAELTSLLTKSGVLPDVPVAGVPGNPGGPWEFVVSQGGYKAVTMLTGDRAGQVLVSLYAQDFGCAGGDANTKCDVRVVDGVEMAVVDYRYGATHALTASTRKPDGAVFSVTAVNSDPKAGTTGTDAPLTFEQLAKIATLPGVSF